MNENNNIPTEPLFMFMSCYAFPTKKISFGNFNHLSIFRNQPENFDLLVTDQTMPGLTGVELTKEMLEIKPSLPIIMCTGHSEIVSKEKAITLGITKFVFKPLRADELLDTVQEVLGKK